MFHSYKYILKPYSYDFEGSSGIFNLGLDIGDYFFKFYKIIIFWLYLNSHAISRLVMVFGKESQLTVKLAG